MNLYEILGVSPTATFEEIKRAYRKLANIHHPDKGGDAEEFKIIVTAYSLLMDEEKRNRYDAGESVDSIHKAKADQDMMTLQMLVGLFVAVVSNADVDHQDLIEVMRLNLRHSLNEIKNAISQETAKMKRFESAVRRMRTTKDNNIFASCGLSQIESIKVAISRLESQKLTGEQGLSILDMYSYEFDQQAVQIMMSNSFGTSFTFTSGG